MPKEFVARNVKRRADHATGRKTRWLPVTGVIIGDYRENVSACQ